MPSPEQSPERAHLRHHIEKRVEDRDITWRELEALSGVPYETVRRIRTSDRPITRDIREKLEDGLRWERGSIRAILSGGDPTPLPEEPRLAVEDRVLDTPIGQVFYQAVRDIDADPDLTPEERKELEAATAQRLSDEITLFVEMKRAQIRKRRRESGDA
ncbi:hypothetical protein [Nocardiopsis synnemataformans]|uniref:hypothetical protein n=1 Tax=Nocardiopsis synnemataformans TaxID=61305 RepID=UPI003EB93229